MAGVHRKQNKPSTNKHTEDLDQDWTSNFQPDTVRHLVLVESGATD